MGKQNFERWPKFIYDNGNEPDPRASLANERTALAGLRTALALVATGLGAAAIKNVVDLPSAFTAAAIVLSLAGGILALSSIFRWANIEVALRHKQPLPAPRGIASIAIFIAAVGLIGILAVLI